MNRTSNTNRLGGSFDNATIEAVWNKARIIPGQDAAKVRKDSCGATIYRSAYGSTTTFGWEIDHVKPVAQGGGDELSNLQPLHWENNRHKGDNWPHWSCKLTA